MATREELQRLVDAAWDAYQGHWRTAHKAYGRPNLRGCHICQGLRLDIEARRREMDAAARTFLCVHDHKHRSREAMERCEDRAQ